MTSEHVPDILPHLLIIPDRLGHSNTEFSWMRCLGHQIHRFSRFEFLNSFKTVNGHINSKILSIVSRLMGPQEGLSITTLSVEQMTLQITYITQVIIHSPLGVTLNRGTEVTRKFENPVLELSKFLDLDSVSINPSKIINFSSFSLFMEAHEGSLHEKIFFNLIYTDSGICNDPRHRI